MLDTIRDYWSIVSLGITTLAIPGVGYAYRKYKAGERRQTAIELGVRALLRERIVQGYYEYFHAGKMPLHGLESMENMYQEYRSLGGNGAVSKLMEDLRELEVKEDPPSGPGSKKAKRMGRE